jgi:hypothetical protein
MRCLNCNCELPENAMVCAQCEAPVMEAPTEEELQAASFLLDNLPPEAIAQLRSVFDESATADEFVNSIFVGDCPQCDSHNTGNCENDPDIDHLLVGRCYDCGQLWCTECCRLLEAKAPVCPCWDEDELFGEDEADE